MRRRGRKQRRRGRADAGRDAKPAAAPGPSEQDGAAPPRHNADRAVRGPRGRQSDGHRRRRWGRHRRGPIPNVRGNRRRGRATLGRVLHLFSDDNYPVFGETLDGAAKRLSRKVMAALRPSLDALDPGRDGGRKRRGEVGYYGFAREASRCFGRSSAGGDRRHDPVGNVRGPAERLRWTTSDGEEDAGVVRARGEHERGGG